MLVEFGEEGVVVVPVLEDEEFTDALLQPARTTTTAERTKAYFMKRDPVRSDTGRMGVQAERGFIASAGLWLPQVYLWIR
jgi:hypothetical protein